MSTKESEGYTVEQSFEDLISGLELGIDEVRNKLNNGIKDLSKSDMERALLSMINYPENSKVYSGKEATFIKNLNALHGLHLQAEIIAVGELQEEQENDKDKD